MADVLNTKIRLSGEIKYFYRLIVVAVVSEQELGTSLQLVYYWGVL